MRPETDSLALHQLFGETHLVANAHRICEAARRQSDLSGYELLADWVLPGESHPTIRLIGDFRSTGFPQAGENPQVTVWNKLASEKVLIQLLQREILESPALQLIESAHATGKLRDLRKRIQAIRATDSDSRRSKLALLFLVDVAREDSTACRTAFEEFVDSSIDADRDDLRTCWSEFLLFWAGMHSPQTRKMVGEYYFNLYRDPVDTNSDWQVTVIRDYIRMLQGTYQHLVLHQANESPVRCSDQRSEWIPYSGSTAGTRGAGKPPVWWETADGRAFRITAHETDYLAYRIPLRGNFQVECDAYPGLPHSLALMVAGTYVRMTDDTHTILTGSFGSVPREIDVMPHLSTFREVTRLRATVRDGVLTHYINGRAVFSKELLPNHDPWVAIRTGDRSLGVIKDLRITGTPVIPEQIDLVVSPDLEGWSAYHRPDLADWQALGNKAGELELHSPLRPDLAGSWSENLLRYHRPMAENGAIEYDFFYKAGESCVSPAIDRMAFLFEPDGISLHTITDGNDNRSEIPPDNETPFLKTQTESQPLPLIENDWNRLKLTVTGDKLELFLNGTSIHRQSLNPTQPRTFGVFHYQDRTRARVRNMVWRGNWPRVMPSVSDQTLASQELQFLEDTLPALTEGFEHDFTADDEPFRYFSVTDGMAEHFEPSPEGMRVVRPVADGESGYTLSSLSPKLRVSGDFDITAWFDRFEPLASEDGSSTILLSIDLDNEMKDHFRMLRRFERKKFPRGSFIRYSLVKERERRHSFTNSSPLMEESKSGSMRIARRGRNIYLLYAEGDSPNYRLIGVEASTDDDVLGVQLGAQSYLQSMTRVVWKNVTIRAEQIETEAETIKTLNVQRDQLEDNFRHSFQGDEISAALFNADGTFLYDEETTRIEHLGTVDWSASKLAPKIGLQGDFDMELEVSDLEFSKPELSRGSALYFQPTFADDSRTRLDMKCVREPNGALAFYIQDSMRIEGKNRFRTSYFERLAMVDESKIQKIRMCRRGKTIYFLYRLNDTTQDRLLTHLDYTDQPVLLGNVRVMLSSGSPGKTSSLNLKSIQLYAEELSGIPEAPQPPTDDN